jgi:hypothetical protein
VNLPSHPTTCPAPVRLGSFRLGQVFAALLSLAPPACGAVQQQFGRIPSAGSAAAVGQVIDDPQRYAGKNLVLEGIVVGLDQREGRFFYLRDPRGALFVELEPGARWSLPLAAERRHARVRGRLARDRFERWYVLASGITVGAKAF